MAKDIIKVTVSVTLEVSRSEWDLAYGTGTDADDVRDNVREHVLGTLQEFTTGNAGAGDGAIKTVTKRWS